jgi:hypothetical protein
MANGFTEVQPVQRTRNRRGHHLFGELARRKTRPHHGKVPERKQVWTGDIHGVSGELDGELRGANRSGPDALASRQRFEWNLILDTRPLEGSGQVGCHVVEDSWLAVVDVLSHAT